MKPAKAKATIGWCSSPHDEIVYSRHGLYSGARVSVINRVNPDALVEKAAKLVYAAPPWAVHFKKWNEAPSDTKGLSRLVARYVLEGLNLIPRTRVKS